MTIEWLVIDDVQPSLAAMSEFGRQTLAAPVEALRQSVIESVTRRGWSVVRHGSYVDWARDLADKSPDRWLVLDPLFEGTNGDERLQPIRVSRLFDGGATILRGQRVQGLSDVADGATNASGTVGIIDDAVASGGTLQSVVRIVGEFGATVAQVVVCASSRQARDSFRRKHPAVVWRDFVPGDWRVLHLRDGCPFLPYAGRATGERLSCDHPERNVEVRVSASELLGHPWQVLYMDAKVRLAVQRTAFEVKACLQAALGRSPIVTDLGMLGEHVFAARASAAEGLTGETPLATLYDYL